MTEPQTLVLEAKPVSRADAARAIQRLFELSTTAVTALEGIILDPETTRHDRIAAIRLILERTAPKLTHIQHSAAMMHLPMAPGEQDANAKPAPDEVDLKQILDQQKKILLALQGLTPEQRPGLFLVEGSGQ